MRNGLLLFSLVGLLAIAVGCGTSETPSLNKADAAGADGKADGPSQAKMCEAMGEPANCDICEVAGWYGDTECDKFCSKFDPDCGPSADPDWCFSDKVAYFGEQSCGDIADQVAGGTLGWLPSACCDLYDLSYCGDVAKIGPEFRDRGTDLALPLDGVRHSSFALTDVTDEETIMDATGDSRLTLARLMARGQGFADADLAGFGLECPEFTKMTVPELIALLRQQPAEENWEDQLTTEQIDALAGYLPTETDNVGVYTQTAHPYDEVAFNVLVWDYWHDEFHYFMLVISAP
jgi:hypothetical protein